MERKRLVNDHLQAIAEWRSASTSTFIWEQSPTARQAWKKALEAEQEIHNHCAEHGCDRQPAPVAVPLAAQL